MPRFLIALWSLLCRPFRLRKASRTADLILSHHRSIFGGAVMDDEPKRPDDVTQEEWDALADPGKRAIVRVKDAGREADRKAKAAEDRAAAAEAKAAEAAKKLEPEKPKADPATLTAEQRIAAAVDDAVKRVSETYDKRFDDLSAQRTAERITAEVRTLATGVLADPADAAMFIPLETLIADGALNVDAAKAALTDLVTRRPYLAATTTPAREHPGGARPPATKAVNDERVAAVLAEGRRRGLSVTGDQNSSAA